jgi:hypothetical protein
VSSRDVRIVCARLKIVHVNLPSSQYDWFFQRIIFGALKSSW